MRKSLLATITVLLLTSNAPADRDDPVGEKHRIDIAIGAYAYERFKEENGPVTESADLFLGRAPRVFNLGYGYGLTDDLVLGLRFSVVLDWRRTEGESLAEFEGNAQPYVEYLFIDSGVFRPFVTGLFGVGGSKLWEPDYAPRSTLDFTLGAGMGAYIFMIDKVSLDVAFHIRYELDVPMTQKDFRDNVHGLVVVLVAGLSGWE